MDEKKNNTAVRPAPKAPESAPVRRVGTLTLGVCLIACGVLFLCIVLMVSAFGGACLMAAFDFALHREEFWIEYDARQEQDLDDESDRLRLDLDEGTGPDLDEENEDSSAASHAEV